MTAAAGIAPINCIAKLAGFFPPSLVGWLNDFTGKQGAGRAALVPKRVVDR